MKIKLSFTVKSHVTPHENPILFMRYYKDDIEMKGIAIAGENKLNPYSECIFSVTKENISGLIDFLAEVKEQYEGVND